MSRVYIVFNTSAQRRLDEVCAAGYTGRKRGEVVRTRTVVSQAHTSQWLGSFGNTGNGEYRKELKQALAVIRCYLTAHGLSQDRALLRLDGLYGTGAIIADLAGFPFVMRARTTPCWITRQCKRGCTCHPTPTSAARKVV